MAQPAARSPQGAGLFPALLVVLAFVLIAVFATRELSSIDVGYHLRAGQDFLSGGGWPTQDNYTYTCRDTPFMNSWWGYQVSVALAFRAAGTAGVVLYHEMLLIATFLLTWRTAIVAGADRASLPLLMVTGVIACEMRFEARPEVLSLLFLAAELFILTRRAEGKRAPLWLLPLIMVLWVNCHSFFIIGLGVLGVFLIIGIASRGRLGAVDSALLKWTAASIVVCVINPYGAKGLLAPLELLSRFDQSNIFAQSIGEFISPFTMRTTPQMPFFPHWPIYCFRILAVLSVLSWIPLWRMRRYRDIALSALFLLLSANMLRNMPLFVVAVLPGLASAYRLHERLTTRGNCGRILEGGGLAICSLLAIALALRVIHNAYYIDDRRAQRFGLGWSRLEQPVDAANFMKLANLPGSLFNHLNFGHYLTGAGCGPVFIDGRLELIGEAFYKEYLGILNDPGKFASAVAKYGFHSVVLPHAIAPTLLTYLLNSTSWRLAYVDHLAAIFVKNSPDAAKFVDPKLTAILSEHPSAPPFNQLPGLGGRPRRSGLSHWLHGTLHALDYPREEYSRALFHFIRGDLPTAERLFARVIDRTDGAYYELYLNLGSVLWRQNRRDEARACYRIALEDDPNNALAQKRIGDPSFN